jgi:hypothetical protein
MGTEEESAAQDAEETEQQAEETTEAAAAAADDKPTDEAATDAPVAAEETATEEPEMEEGLAEALAFLTEEGPILKTLRREAAKNGLKFFKGIKPEDVASWPQKAQEGYFNATEVMKRVQSAEAERKLQFAEWQKKRAESELELKQQRNALWSLFKDEGLQEAIKPPEGEAPTDVWSDEYRKWAIAKGIHEGMSPFLEAMAKLADGHEESLQAAVEERRVAEEKAKLTAFVEDNPDFTEYYDEIKGYTDTGLHWKDAYLLSKAKAGKLEAPEEPDPAELRRAARREGAKLLGRSGSSKTPEPPPNLTTEQYVAWLRANPDAQEAITRRLEQGGVSIL